MRTVVLICSLLAVLVSSAQPKTLSEEEMIALVIKFHPVVRMTAIDIKKAGAGILSARGAFDPQLRVEGAQKEIGGVLYYDQRVTALEVPSWYGIDLYAGRETISGTRVNPEETAGTVSYLGFSVQPLQNLLLDKRRAALRQARNLHSLSQVQQRTAVNDLLRDALSAYWHWWKQHQVHEILKGALDNAERRQAFVRTAVRWGERPAIDTVEAYTQVVSFRLRLTEAFQELVKARFRLSAFLWMDNGGHADLPPDVIPRTDEERPQFQLRDIIDRLAVHPELEQYRFKLAGLEIDRKLAFQSLLPHVKIRYNHLGRRLPAAPWFDDNFRFGVSLSVPLRLSEARGNLRQARLDLDRARLAQASKQVEVYTKARQYFTEWQQYGQMLSLQGELLDATRRLQSGEETRFINGESSLFLVNAREQKTIEALEKQAELEAKLRKAAADLRWSAGMLGD